jgi:hypothetical protein
MEDPKNLRIRITRANQLAYDEALNDLSQDMITFCRSRGVDFVSVSCDQPLERMLFKELLKVGIMA